MYLDKNLQDNIRRVMFEEEITIGRILCCFLHSLCAFYMRDKHTSIAEGHYYVQVLQDREKMIALLKVMTAID